MTKDHLENPADDALSALLDGELPAADAQAALAFALSDAHALRQWAIYQAVGDSLRHAAPADPARMLNFAQRVQDEIAQQEHQEADARRTPDALNVARLPASGSSANNSRWRWLAGFSGLALLATLAVRLAPEDTTVAQAPVPAQQQPVQVLAQDANGVMLRDPALDALLQAHQQMGGSSALQRPAGFLRNATYQRSGQ